MYKKILVSVDFTNESQEILMKAADLAKIHQAELNLIHVNVNLSALYSGLIQVNFEKIQNIINEEQEKFFKELKQKVNYPVNECILGMGDLSEVISQAIKEYEIDLLIIGHHNDFLGKFFSSAKTLLNHINIDTLVFPLKGNKKSS